MAPSLRPSGTLTQLRRVHLGTHYGIVGNSRALKRFLFEATRIWRKWLDRPSQRGNMPWGRFSQVWKRYPLPFRLHGHDHLGEIFTVRLTCPPKIGPVRMLRVGLEFRMRRQG